MSQTDAQKHNQDSLHKIRHSSEHVLTQAMERLFPGKFLMAMGPATDDGFYFDFEPLNDFKISEADFPKIEAEMIKIIKANLPIIREEITLDQAKKLFKDNPYKLEWLNTIEDRNEIISIYKTGEEFVDLCAGPHVKSTGEINAFKLLSIAGAYWHGDEKNKMLTRIYGTAFESKEELEKYLFILEEAKKRDHRKLGPQLGIFFLDETAPGMPYWLPKGTIIINELLNFWRVEHQKRGYLETITPQLNKKQLYETSGHWDHYRENMFICDMGENEIYCLKPMNCPNAMTIFKQGIHSYRDLPLRFSDCDALHRREKSGELGGLLRVQKFAQDDAHIFVTEDQISEEYKRILEIANLFYSIFGIKFKIRLGTRPDDFMGDIATWDKAEKELEQILIDNKFDYFIGEGEGAFYGPKLDILMDDCLGRQWQTGTIQLDFQLPRKFDLKYTDSDGSEKTPVVIHRVIYGSLERFMGILIEQFAGAFPLWLSPIQAKIIPITDAQHEYAFKICEQLKEQGIRVEIDDRSEKMQAKIRDAQIQKIPYMLIIGNREVEANAVAVRQRDGQDLGAIPFNEFLAKVKEQINTKSLNLIK
ncbi:MAG TPA: threonine--tRNA ligase [Candidatus Woesebacteria bacterium]|nr:threonine--tRNA ligase [Candidatus Woesebacteria bacterium]HPR99860.1 threonine--tRNA ligase [Candidatus Woesebacteria bacterium]